jgi:predicted DCC family thiol-disulfide oxidoreductase YuxK
VKLKYEIALIVVGALLLIGPVLLWRHAPRFIRDFFQATTSPLNLAIFRIVLFAVILGSFSVHDVQWFASLPADLKFPLPGLSLVLTYIPINQTVAWYASVALTISSILCLIGLFTRSSLVISLVLSVYVLGIPQLFGKVDHYHHLIWFILILAVSPCADVLSCDAVRQSWKRADQGVTEPPGASISYALPLRFVWLLIGVIYFSAGFWKAWTSGIAWAWSNNPRNLMYNKWAELSGWTPLIRIDQHPVLFKLSALFTLAFELSFIFLLFFAAVRWLAPLCGLAFHNATNLFMRISFWNLQSCYVAFVDWSRVFHWIGRRLFAEDLYLVYDGNCRICRRTIASFRAFDIFERVTYVNAFDVKALEGSGLSGLDTNAVLRDIRAVRGARSWQGFSAYREWLKRMPLFWPAIPLMSLWPITWLGNRAYRHIADARTCTLKEKYVPHLPQRKPVYRISFVGCLLVYLAILSAVGKLNSWPIACYPSFEDIDPPEVRMLTIITEDERGGISELRPLEHQSLNEMPPERLMGLQNHLLSISDDAERIRRLETFWNICQREDPALRKLTARRFYADTISTLPEDRNRAPVKRELIADLGTIESQRLTRNSLLAREEAK